MSDATGALAQGLKNLRRDHILASEPLRGAVKACTIDRVPRKWKQPSDHAPVTLKL